LTTRADGWEPPALVGNHPENERKTTMNTIQTLLAALASITPPEGETYGTLAEMDTPEGETYRAARDASAEAINAALAAITPEAGDADADAPEEQGGILYANYTLPLTVGAASRTVPGWMCCGWIAPGASADLDGSGLRNWGSSQPGGWSVCDGDGAFSGRAHAEASDGAVSIHEPEGCPRDTADITVAEILGLPAECQATIEAHLSDDIEDSMAELADEITEVIEYASVSIDAPDADDLWDELGCRSELSDCESVRVGDFGGAHFVVIEDAEGNRASYHGHESWEDAVGKRAAEIVRDAVQAKLDAMDRAENEA
jgi:hypothetical protein